MFAFFIGLDTFGRVGGLQAFNRRLIRTLIDLPEECRVFLMRDETTDLPDEFRPVTRAFGARRGAFIWNALRQSRKVSLLLVGHLSLLPVAWLMSLAAPQMKVVLFVHGVEVWNTPPYRRKRVWEPFLLKRVSRIAAVSNHTASIMAREFSVPVEKFIVFPNTVDVPTTNPDGPSQDQRLLCVSRMAEHDRAKNIDKLLDAFAMATKTRPRAHLDIVGDGVLRPDLEAHASGLGLGAKVVFHGQASDAVLSELYRSARAFVMPSDKEGFGIVFLEAWRAGLPVISGAGGAAHEVVDDGENGFVVHAVSDVEGFSDRIGQMLDDVTLCREMGHRGFQKLHQHYGQDTLARNLRHLIERAS